MLHHTPMDGNHQLENHTVGKSDMLQHVQLCATMVEVNLMMDALDRHLN